METFINLENVSVRFRRYSNYSSGLKEATMRFFSPPSWVKKFPAEKTEFWALKSLNLNLREGD